MFIEEQLIHCLSQHPKIIQSAPEFKCLRVFSLIYKKVIPVCTPNLRAKEETL